MQPSAPAIPWATKAARAANGYILSHCLRLGAGKPRKFNGEPWAARRAGRRDHTGADMFCKLNGKAGDPARTALNQNRLAGLQFQRFGKRAVRALVEHAKGVYS